MHFCYVITTILSPGMQLHDNDIIDIEDMPQPITSNMSEEMIKEEKSKFILSHIDKVLNSKNIVPIYESKKRVDKYAYYIIGLRLSQIHQKLMNKVFENRYSN